MDYSIIVPCHNLENEIKNLLLSFHMLNLQDIDYEIIFVLDNCTDKTQDVIYSYMQDMNYKLIPCSVGAPGFARNVGLNAATGNYIWFVDGDDWLINPDILKQIKDYFKEAPEEDMIQIGFSSNYFKMQHYSMVWQYIFKKELLKEARFNDKQNTEDNDFMRDIFTVYRRNVELPYLSIPSYYYNYNRPGSQTTKLRENFNSENLKKS